jgi:hypothetical protein
VAGISGSTALEPRAASDLNSQRTRPQQKKPLREPVAAKALKGVAVAAPPPVPEGLVHSGGDWIYSEWADGGSVLTIGMEPEAPAAAASAAAR